MALTAKLKYARNFHAAKLINETSKDKHVIIFEKINFDKVDLFHKQIFVYKKIFTNK